MLLSSTATGISLMALNIVEPHIHSTDHEPLIVDALIKGKPPRCKCFCTSAGIPAASRIAFSCFFGRVLVYFNISKLPTLIFLPCGISIFLPPLFLTSPCLSTPCQQQTSPPCGRG